MYTKHLVGLSFPLVIFIIDSLIFITYKIACSDSYTY